MSDDIPKPTDPPPPGWEWPSHHHTEAPKVEMPEELKPQEPDLPQPTHALPPKPSDEEAGIDNSLANAAIAATRRGKPLQKGLNAEK